MNLHPLWLHAPDEDQLEPEDVQLMLSLRPSGLLVMRYSNWEFDKGAADSIKHVVRTLGHDRMMVRMHNHNVPQKDPRAFARESVAALHLYNDLGITLEVIGGNELNLPLEGGHSDWNRHASWLWEFADEFKRHSDAPIHLPAPSRMPIEGHDWNTWNESLAYWTVVRDQRVHERYDYIDVHNYRGDVERAIDEAYSVFNDYWLAQRTTGLPDAHLRGRPHSTEFNGEYVMTHMVHLYKWGKVARGTWFTSDWRSPDYDPNHVHPHEDIPMSIRKWPHLREEWFQAESYQIQQPTQHTNGNGEQQPTEPTETPPPGHDNEQGEIPPSNEPENNDNGDTSNDNPVTYTRDEVINISNATADRHGIPRILLLACAFAESDGLTSARRPPTLDKDELYWNPPDPFDVSGGVWQQAVRYDPHYLSRGGGDAFNHPLILETLQLQSDPNYSANIAAQNLKEKWEYENNGTDDASLLRTMYRYNWPAGRGRPYSSAHEVNYRRGLQVARSVLGSTQPPPVPTPVDNNGFNLDTPLVVQPNDWFCSVSSATMAFNSTGWGVDQYEVRNFLGNRVTQQYGLMDASGAGLVAMFNEHGFIAHNNPNVTWDAVVNMAGRVPLMLGGRNLNHWMFVRGVDDEGYIVLGNPAPNWQGIQQHLSRDEWNRWGTWSCVWLDERTMNVITDLRNQIANLKGIADELGRQRDEEERRKNMLVQNLAYVLDDIIPKLTAPNVSQEVKNLATAERIRVRRDAIES
jgi:hypothetical protein